MQLQKNQLFSVFLPTMHLDFSVLSARQGSSVFLVYIVPESNKPAFCYWRIFLFDRPLSLISLPWQCVRLFEIQSKIKDFALIRAFFFAFSSLRCFVLLVIFRAGKTIGISFLKFRLCCSKLRE